MPKRKDLKITPISNGTAIDHIPGGLALKVVRILNIPEPGCQNSISIAMFVNSKKMGCKDLVKIEDRVLKDKEVNKIALIAPSATIIIIKDTEVIKKMQVSLPKTVKEIVKCSNPNCITNRNEPVVSEFNVENGDEIRLKCVYCERYVEDIEEALV